ncbi:MAG: Rab family GTPase [Promethearchaeota archaeon]
MDKEIIYKICLFGENNVGKTSFTQSSNKKKEIKPPVCIDIALKYVTINTTKITLQIWNLRSDPQFDFIFPTFIRGISGGIFMFDITNYSSLNNIEKWIKLFNNNLSSEKKEFPLLLVGGKLDRYKERAISRKYAKNLSKKYKIAKYFECSSKTGKNIDKIFDYLARLILKVES